MPVYPIATRPIVPGEMPGDRIIRIARPYDGCSLKNRTSELADLIARGVDKPAEAVQIKTNCGMFALGVLAAAGVPHPLLSQPYQSMMAIDWLDRIARNQGARVKYDGDFTKIKPGAVLHYFTTPQAGNDHIEILASSPRAGGLGDIIGGGKDNNLVLYQPNVPITSNHGRPLQYWYDPDKLGIPWEGVGTGSDGSGLGGMSGSSGFPPTSGGLVALALAGLALVGFLAFKK